MSGRSRAYARAAPRIRDRTGSNPPRGGPTMPSPHTSAGLGRRRSSGIGCAAVGVHALGANQSLQVLIGEACFEARRLRGRLRLEIIAAGSWRAAPPVRKVGIRAAFACTHCGTIYRFLKAVGQLHLGGLASPLDDDLGRYVAPRDDD